MISDKLLSVGGGGKYWIGLYRDSISSLGGVSFDTDGNVFSTAYDIVPSTGEVGGTVIKHNELGEVLSSNIYSVALKQSVFGGDISIMSDGSISIIGDAFEFDSSVWGAFVAKLDSTGNPLWTRYLTGPFQTPVDYLTLDSLDNIIFTATIRESSGAAPVAGESAYISKYNSSGVLQWTVTLDHPTTDLSVLANEVVVDSSDNVIFSGSLENQGLLISKYNSSGSLIWHRTIATESNFGIGATVDSGDNIIVCGTNGDLGAFIAKLNPSGTVLWQKNFGSNTRDDLLHLACDAEDNIVAVGDTRPVGLQDLVLLVKFSPDGDVVWQRSMTFGSDSVTGDDVEVTIDGSILVKADAGGFSVVCKLPPDGSGTGSYDGGLYAGTIVYEETALPLSNTSYPASTPTIPSYAGTVTVSSPTLVRENLTVDEDIRTVRA